MSESLSLKILVVDDEPDLAPLIRQRFRRQIRAGDYEFSIASDGEDALQQLQVNPEIDILLTDINMPRMDGLTLLSRLPDLNLALKAVVVTAYGDMENIRTAMNRGAFDFLTKPIDLDDLEITIQKAQTTVHRERKAELVRETFGRYLSDRVVNTLLEDPAGMELGGQKRVVTIVMADVRGFSMIAEQLPPEDVVGILNIYLAHMTDVISEYDGTIEEFLGDGILTVFGAPISSDDDPARAVACAIDMQNRMQTINEELTGRGFPRLEVGIGINTGEVVVGNIGSRKRAKYGVVGSHVNLTSRIESLTVGGQILVSESTREAVGDSLVIDDKFQVPVKGFSHPVPVFQVTAIGPPFDLSVPEHDDELVDLAAPIDVGFSPLEGKMVTDERIEGRLVAIAADGAMLETAVRLDGRVNLRLELLDGTDRPSSEFYAKVLNDVSDKESDHNRFVIRFTAVPAGIAETIEELLRISDGQPD